MTPVARQTKPWPGFAEGDDHGREGKSAGRHRQCHALQYAPVTTPMRSSVERKSERVRNAVKDTAQGIGAAKTYCFAGLSTRS